MFILLSGTKIEFTEHEKNTIFITDIEIDINRKTNTSQTLYRSAEEITPNVEDFYTRLGYKVEKINPDGYYAITPPELLENL